MGGSGLALPDGLKPWTRVATGVERGRWLRPPVCPQARPAVRRRGESGGPGPRRASCPEPTRCGKPAAGPRQGYGKPPSIHPLFSLQSTRFCDDSI